MNDPITTSQSDNADSDEPLGSLETGEVKLLLVFLKEPWAFLPDVPSLKGTPHEELELFNSDRVMVAPPGVPDHIVRILRESLFKALDDPELQDWAARTQNPLLIRNARETEKRIAEIKSLMGRYRSTLAK